jgi:hypothetical protein
MDETTNNNGPESFLDSLPAPAANDDFEFVQPVEVEEFEQPVMYDGEYELALRRVERGYVSKAEEERAQKKGQLPKPQIRLTFTFPDKDEPQFFAYIRLSERHRFTVILAAFGEDNREPNTRSLDKYLGECLTATLKPSFDASGQLRHNIVGFKSLLTGQQVAAVAQSKLAPVKPRA